MGGVQWAEGLRPNPAHHYRESARYEMLIAEMWLEPDGMEEITWSIHHRFGSAAHFNRPWGRVVFLAETVWNFGGNRLVILNSSFPFHISAQWSSRLGDRMYRPSYHVICSHFWLTPLIIWTTEIWTSGSLGHWHNSARQFCDTV